MADLDALILDADGEAVGARVEGARQAGEAFRRARLVDVELVRCDLSGCDFSESVWQRVNLVDCRCSSIDLSQASLRDTVFADCKLDDANLRLAKLHNVRFEGSVLTAAEFHGAAFEEIAFPDSDLRGADVTSARCSQVDLRAARLDGLQGIASLKGATIGPEQLIPLAPALADALGLRIGADDPER